jgi:ribonuclease P protein component
VPTRHTCPAQARLRRRREFDRIFRDGRKLVGPEFICYVLREPEAGARLGMAVSRKVGNAVARNRVKRHIREFFRQHRAQFPEGTQLVVVARPRAAALENARQSAEALHRILARGGWLDG